jgi:GNAT superfamily N-acetyltransferase
MHSRAVSIKRLGLVTIRPLRRGDTDTVAALFARLGMESRARRFNGAKPRLCDSELALLAMVNGRRHTLVAYVAGDPEPAGIGQLVRDEHRWTHAEIALAVADCYQGKGMGSTIVDSLAADARAGGITHLTATMQSSNAATYALVRKVSEVVDIRHRAGEASIVAAFQAT